MRKARTVRRVWALAILCVFSVSAHAADPSAPTDAPLLLRVAMPMYAPSIQRPVEESKRKRVVDSKFTVLGAVMMGLTIADLERTQACLSHHTCQELNPMLPTSRAGMYAVNLPINAASMYLAYRLKAGGHRTWWIAPMLSTAGHGVGVAFRF